MKQSVIVNVDYEKLPQGKDAFYGIYGLIALSAGVNPNNVKEYDCRNIDTSENGQDMIYERCKDVASDEQISMALCMSGMKVDKTLKSNTAHIQRGGIILCDGRDILDV
jgi:hypothetical protein